MAIVLAAVLAFNAKEIRALATLSHLCLCLKFFAVVAAPEPKLTLDTILALHSLLFLTLFFALLLAVFFFFLVVLFLIH